MVKVLSRLLEVGSCDYYAALAVEKIWMCYHLSYGPLMGEVPKLWDDWFW